MYTNVLNFVEGIQFHAGAHKPREMKTPSKHLALPVGSINLL